MKYFVLHLLLLNLFFTTNTASKKSLTWVPDSNLETERKIQGRNFFTVEKYKNIIDITRFVKNMMEKTFTAIKDGRTIQSDRIFINQKLMLSRQFHNEQQKLQSRSRKIQILSKELYEKKMDIIHMNFLI